MYVRTMWLREVLEGEMLLEWGGGELPQA
jgi:hypothetical protein